MQNALIRSASKLLSKPAVPVPGQPIKGTPISGLLPQFAGMEIDSKHFACPLPKPALSAAGAAAASPPPPSGTGTGSASGGGSGSGGRTISGGPIGPAPLTVTPRSPEESRELIAIYRSKQLQSGSGGGGGGKHKHFQGIIDQAVPTATTTIAVPLNAMPISPSFAGRVGLTVHQSHIQIRGRITWDETASASRGTQDPVRVVLFWDSMPQLTQYWSTVGASATSADFAAVTTALATGGLSRHNTVQSFNYNTHGFRYHILRDEVFIPKAVMNLIVPGSFEGQQGEAMFDWHVHLDKHTQYSDLSNPGSLNTNALLLHFMAGTSASTNVVPEIIIATDLAFNDMNDVA